MEDLTLCHKHGRFLRSMASHFLCQSHGSDWLFAGRLQGHNAAESQTGHLSSKMHRAKGVRTSSGVISQPL